MDCEYQITAGHSLGKEKITILSVGVLFFKNAISWSHCLAQANTFTEKGEVGKYDTESY